MSTILSRKGGGGAGGGAPTGPAGGDLSGTYPNPDIAAGVVGRTELSTSVATQLTDGWVDDTAATWTRTGDQTFTVTGDRTAVFSKGTRLKWTQTTVKYGVVVASSHAAGTTTVTIAVTPDYVLTAAAISANYYSYDANPQGYPGWFSFVPSFTGFSVVPSGFVCRFSIIGSTCFFDYQSSTPGTSNANTFTMTVPVACLTTNFILIRVLNNGAIVNGAGLWGMSGGSTTVSLFINPTGGVWATTNGKDAWVTVAFRF